MLRRIDASKKSVRRIQGLQKNIGESKRSMTKGIGSAKGSALNQRFNLRPYNGFTVDFQPIHAIQLPHSAPLAHDFQDATSVQEEMKPIQDEWKSFSRHQW